MKTRKQISDEIHKQEKNVGLYERQLMLMAAVLEVVLDIRDLLQMSQSPKIVVATEENPNCNCVVTKTDGESEHWPSCRYA